jgi:hypothetical protein
MATLSVQWLTADPGLLELDWLQQLMPGLMPCLQVHQSADQLELTKSVFLITSSSCAYRKALARFRQFGSRYGVLLLSDEFLGDPCEWLDDPQCVFLARNYANPVLLHHPKVLTFGLGYTRGFAKLPNLFKPLEERSLAWCFAGTPHGDRAQGVRLFTRFQPYQVHGCSGFLSEDGLDIQAYAALLGNSIFSLCPPGHASNDTYRLYESLEAGCIPVALANSKQCTIQPSYWHAIFRGASALPFIVGDTYHDCAGQLQQLIERGELAAYQNNCVQFWRQWKQNWAYQLNHLLMKLV